MGMRPLAISWPPARRAADAKGAAQRFSHTITPATVPGSMAAARCSTSSAASKSASWVSATRRLSSGSRSLIALRFAEHKLRRVLARMLDEESFFSPHGVRSLSRWHLEHPYIFSVHGEESSRTSAFDFGQPPGYSTVPGRRMFMSVIFEAQDNSELCEAFLTRYMNHRRALSDNLIPCQKSAPPMQQGTSPTFLTP